MARPLTGNDVLFYVQTARDAATGTAAFEELGWQTDGSWETSRNLIDISVKNDDHTQFAYGRKDDTLSIEAYYPNLAEAGNAAYKALKNAFDNKDIVTIRRYELGVPAEEADCLVSTFSPSFPNDDAATVSIELQLTENWQPVAA
jgi:TP901-1 family phage major tail protein